MSDTPIWARFAEHVDGAVTLTPLQQAVKTLVYEGKNLNELFTGVAISWGVKATQHGLAVMLEDLPQDLRDAVTAEIALLRFAWVGANIADADQIEFFTDLCGILAKWESRSTGVPFPAMPAEAVTEPEV
jgi:hypothetical protein